MISGSEGKELSGTYINSTDLDVRWRPGLKSIEFFCVAAQNSTNRDNLTFVFEASEIRVCSKWRRDLEGYTKIMKLLKQKNEMHQTHKPLTVHVLLKYYSVKGIEGLRLSLLGGYSY